MFALAACGGGGSDSPVSEDDGVVVAEVSNEDGEYTARVGQDLAVDLPAGYSLPSGSEVMSSTKVNTGDTEGLSVMFFSTLSQDDLLAHFRGQAEAAGVVISNETITPDMKIIGGEGSDGTTFFLQVTDNDDGRSFGNMTMGKSSN